MNRKKWAGSAALLSLALAGCSVLYDSQQMSARKACERLPDAAEMKACFQQAQATYEQYEKQRGGLMPAASTPSSDTQKPPGNCFRRAATGELVCPN